MRYMLDTNTCIALIKRKPLKALRRFDRLSAGDVGISTITLAELRQLSRHWKTHLSQCI